MRYLFAKAWRRFRANRRKYIFLIIQISIGTCMIALSLNINFTFQERFLEFNQSVDNLYINITAGKIFNNSPDALSIEDARNIQANVNEQNNPISYYKDFSLSDSGNLTYIPVLFVDEHFHSMLMKAHNAQKDGVYIGKNAHQELATLMQLLEGDASQPYIDAEKGTVFGVPISSFIPLETLEYQSKALLSDGYMSGVFGKIDFEDYIIFPLSAYEKLNNLPSCIDSLAIASGDDDIASLRKPMTDILTYLQQTHEGENYKVDNYYVAAQDNLNRDGVIAEMLNYLSAFILIIVVFGFVGLLFILINQRKREFSIALMCGATQRQIALEVFMEILLVAMIGVCIGNLLTLPLMPMLGTQAYSPTFHAQTLLFTILGGVLVSGFVCMMSLNKMKYISPVALLKNL